MVLRPGRPQPARGPRRTSSARSARMRPPLDGLRVVEVDVPATGACELGEHLAVHDRVGAGLVGARRWTAMSSGSPAARRAARSTRSARAARLRSRRAPPTSPERPMPHLARPAPPWRRRRDGGPRSGSVPPSGRVRSARSADGPRPRGQRRRHGDGPAEMIGDAETQITDHVAVRLPPRLASAPSNNPCSPAPRPRPAPAASPTALRVHADHVPALREAAVRPGDDVLLARPRWRSS